MKSNYYNINNFRLLKNGLTKKFSSINECVFSLNGIQSQILTASYISIFNRVNDVRLIDIQKNLLNNQIVRIWAQRDTLHLFNFESWVTLISSMCEDKSWFIKKIEKLGRISRYNEIFEDSLKFIQNNENFYKKDLSRLFNNEEEYNLYISSWGGLLIDLSKKGFICQKIQGNNIPSYTSTDSFISKSSIPQINRIEADKELFLKFVNYYGPIEIEDFAFWRGCTKTRAQELVSILSSSLFELSVDNRKYFISADDTDLYKSYHVNDNILLLLYRFDPILVSYKDKGIIVNSKHYKKIWQKAGHIEPVIIFNGFIIGSWKYKKMTTEIHFFFNLFYRKDFKINESIVKRASEIGDFLGFSNFKFSFTYF